MKEIRETLERDLSKKIEEIIKVNQADEDTVYEELTEYIFTDSIKDHYRTLLKAIAEGPNTHETQENIGVWVSGFFGSGKSSFAKNLGYVLSNPDIHGNPASMLFLRHANDPRISEFVDYINKRIPTDVMMFDISVDHAAKSSSSESIPEIIYRKLLSHLGYAEDFDIAELEIELEGEGKLVEFRRIFNIIYPDIDWEKARGGSQKIARASAVLNMLDKKTYPEITTWSSSIKGKHETITIKKIVERIFDLSARRRPGKAIIFVIDEVGQFVARNPERIEDLRAFVEQLGKESKNRLKAHSIPAPAWLIVTSQEKLEEVVTALDDRKILLAKLRDRFPYQIDLSPADIREVATKRVLSKKPEAKPILMELFKENEGRLASQTALERTSIRTDISPEDFVQFYPYLPHFIDLSIKLMSGIRLQPGAVRHLGGSNRTIIKQSYEMLVSDRTYFANRPIGSLVTLDKIFELVEGNLSNERRSDMYDVARTAQLEEGQKEWVVRVARAICMLEYIRDLPRTEKNIAATLIDFIGQEAPITRVSEAIEWLVKNKFIKNTEEGYKLQSAQEKKLSDERQSYLDLRPADRKAITREIFSEIFSDVKLKNFRYKNIKNFKTGYSIDSVKIGDPGHFQVSIRVAESQDDFQKLIDDTKQESREKNHPNDVYWALSITAEIDDLVSEYFASGKMVTKYEQLASQNKITAIEREYLDNEKREMNQMGSRLQDKIENAVLQGAGLFRGVQRDGSDLGVSLSEAFNSFFNHIILSLFPKIELGAVALKGDEAQKILDAENLNGLPAVFYDARGGLSLVIKQGSKNVINSNAEVALEVSTYLHKKKENGERAEGKDIEEHFQGFGYGWDPELPRIVLAVLFREGAIEVTAQGKTHTSYRDVAAKSPFITTPAFRKAVFGERIGKPSLPDLVKASKLYRSMSGREVDIDETKIVEAFRKMVIEDYDQVIRLLETIKANHLPSENKVSDYLERIKLLKDSEPRDTIGQIIKEGKTIEDLRNEFIILYREITDELITAIGRSRGILSFALSELERNGDPNSISKERSRLESILTSDDYFTHFQDIREINERIVGEYEKLYKSLHSGRQAGVAKSLELLRNLEDLKNLTKHQENDIISIITSLSCDHLSLDEKTWKCANCMASIGQLRSDAVALEMKERIAIGKILELAALNQSFQVGGPEERQEKPQFKVERVRLSSIITQRIEDTQSLEKAVVDIRNYLQKLIDEGFVIILE